MKNAMLAIAAGAALAGAAAPAAAQESSYTPGTVWELSNIKVLPGQFENYMDYLAGNWRKIQEVGKKEGYVVSYHIFQVNAARNDEPDLILAIEYKDYVTTAQQLANQKKVEAALAMDQRKMETTSVSRSPMRSMMGGVELQELKLK